MFNYVTQLRRDFCLLGNNLLQSTSQLIKRLCVFGKSTHSSPRIHYVSDDSGKLLKLSISPQRNFTGFIIFLQSFENVQFDKRRQSQFIHIINNAVKYSDGDLIITLTEDGEITFANHASQLDGIKVGRLFDRFYTVETASAESTGLGLSIAKALIEQMGGKIAAEYEDGIIRVKVIFPLL